MADFKSKCLCGAVADVRGKQDFVDGFTRIWREMHAGEGHGETDSRTAYRARNRRHEPESIPVDEEHG